MKYGNKLSELFSAMEDCVSDDPTASLDDIYDYYEDAEDDEEREFQTEEANTELNAISDRLEEGEAAIQQIIKIWDEYKAHVRDLLKKHPASKL